jgi:hypothetical protein
VDREDVRVDKRMLCRGPLDCGPDGCWLLKGYIHASESCPFCDILCPWLCVACSFTSTKKYGLYVTLSDLVGVLRVSACVLMYVRVGSVVCKIPAARVLLPLAKLLFWRIVFKPQTSAS